MSIFSGGLRYIDLKNGATVQPILEGAMEGVTTIHADFTKVWTEKSIKKGDSKSNFIYSAVVIYFIITTPVARWGSSLETKAN